MIEFAVEVIMIFLAEIEGAEKISGKMVTMCFSKVVILLPPTLLPDGSRDILETVVLETTALGSTSHPTLILSSITKPYMRASTRPNYLSFIE
jgi:hypothetical protein